MSSSDARDEPREQIVLSTMKVPRASQMLADQLAEHILSGEFAEGSGLPPERVLVEQTGLSRTTVREALRILEVKGLIRVRPGRAGGAFIQRPGEQAMANTVEDIILGREITRAALLDARRAIEPFCARLAARSRTADQLDDLVSLVDSVDGDWHVAVARASNNLLLAGLMVALTEGIHAATDQDLVDSGALERARDSHQAVTEAIDRRDEEGAELAMELHAQVFSKQDERIVLRAPGRSPRG
ncbi:MAG TPA: GntR family transcriptional regulator [Microbacterium sp.]|nr:GntR family transcriptional regulator [Microbacterium sp.]